MRKREKRNRLLWVDWVIIVLIAGLLISVVCVWRSQRSVVVQTQPITYTLCLSGIESDLLGDPLETLMPVGCQVKNVNGTAEMGNVISTWSRPSVVPIVKDRELSFLERSDRIDLFVCVRADATELEGDGFRVQDIRISAGKSGDFRIGSYFAAAAIICAVEWEVS
jgi:hypothetical protein